MNWEEYKSNLLKNPEFKHEYDNLELEYQIARSVIIRRIKKGITQKQLAEKVHTNQSGISRLERGANLPSLKFLNKIAQALDSELRIKIVPNKEGQK